MVSYSHVFIFVFVSILLFVQSFLSVLLFKQKTAYEMRISDWSSDVCSSDLRLGLKTDGWLMRDNDLRLNFIALDLDGKPIKGQRVAVALYNREIITARRRLIGGFYAYDNQMSTTKLEAACTATTDKPGRARRPEERRAGEGCGSPCRSG